MSGLNKYQTFDENFSLAGKTAIITGTCGGIGIQIAKMFARKGANIAAVDQGGEKMQAAWEELETYVKEQGREFLALPGDLTDTEFVDVTIAEKTMEAFGKIDVLVNCAGVGILEKLEESTRRIWDLTLAVNLTAGVHLALSVGKKMKETGGGSIINIASQAGIIALEGHLSYGTAKAAFIQATKQLALEWGQYGIRANCISPEVILTPMGEMNWNNEKGEAFKRQVPSRRFGYPQEVAACAVFLASDASSLCNGSNLVIDGGFTIQ